MADCGFIGFQTPHGVGGDGAGNSRIDQTRLGGDVQGTPTDPGSRRAGEKRARPVSGRRSDGIHRRMFRKLMVETEWAPGGF